MLEIKKGVDKSTTDTSEMEDDPLYKKDSDVEDHKSLLEALLKKKEERERKERDERDEDKYVRTKEVLEGEMDEEVNEREGNIELFLMKKEAERETKFGEKKDKEKEGEEEEVKNAEIRGIQVKFNEEAILPELIDIEGIDTNQFNMYGQNILSEKEEESEQQKEQWANILSFQELVKSEQFQTMSHQYALSQNQNQPFHIYKYDVPFIINHSINQF